MSFHSQLDILFDSYSSMLFDVVCRFGVLSCAYTQSDGHTRSFYTVVLLICFGRCCQGLNGSTTSSRFQSVASSAPAGNNGLARS